MEAPGAVEWILVDCLIYQGLPDSQRRHAATQSDRDEPITRRMKKAQCSGTAFSTGGVAHALTQHNKLASIGGLGEHLGRTAKALPHEYLAPWSNGFAA